MLRSEIERRLVVARASTSARTRQTVPALERILTFGRFAEEIPGANTADTRQCPGCGKVFELKPKKVRAKRQRWNGKSFAAGAVQPSGIQFRRWHSDRCRDAFEARIHTETYGTPAMIRAKLEAEEKMSRAARNAERKLVNAARLRALVDASPSHRAEVPRKLRAVAPGTPAMPRGAFNVGADESHELLTNGAAVIRRAYAWKRVPPEVGTVAWIREPHTYRDGVVVFDGGDVPAYLMPRRACRMFARVEAVSAQKAEHHTEVDITLRVTAGEAEVRLALVEWARRELSKAGT